MLQIISKSNKILLRLILGSFALVGLLYAYFLGNMVLNIVERRSLEADGRALASEVRELELAYFSLSNGIDLNLSSALGFKEIPAVFATEKPLGLLEAGSLDALKMIQ